MDFVIYSMGDAGFLRQILESVAIVTGVDDFKDLIKIGLLLGFIMMLVQNLFQGAKEISFQHILVGYLIYSAMFIPKVTVIVEDRIESAGAPIPIDNIPIGIAAPGSIISEIGMFLTETFETGYGPVGTGPSVANGKFAESLQLLNNVRKEGASSPVYAALNESGSDFHSSWSSYIRDCTLTAIDLGDRLPANQRKTSVSVMTGNMPDALRFDSELYGTRIFSSDGTGQDVTCAEAYPILVANMGNALNNAQYRTLLGGMTGAHATEVPLAKVESAMQMLGLTSTAGTQFLTTTILEPLYYEAVQGKYTDYQDVASAITINQALQQRNTQWASEQSMFMTTVRPLMTFFEGFVYAITPFMAFLITLGAFGIKLIGKYFQTLIWIQLWLPVMSIINLYIHTAATGQMAKLSGEIGSFYAINEADQILQHWLATGGMLAASTPIISFFIVSGSAYAFTGLAQRIGGGDHINERIQSKDLTTSGPLLQAASSQEYTDVTGMAGSGAGGLMGQTSFGAMRSNMMSSASQKMETAQQAFSSQVGNMLKNVTSDQRSYDQLASLGRNFQSSDNEQAQMIDQRVDSIMKGSGIDQSHREAVKGAIVASGSAGYSSKGSGGSDNGGSGITGFLRSLMPNVSGDLKALSQNTTDDSVGLSHSSQQNFNDALTFSEAESAQLTKSLAQSLTNSQSERSSNTISSDDFSSLTQSSQELVQASESYQETQSMAQNFGQVNNVSNRELATRMARNENSMGILNQQWNSHPQSEATKAEQRRLYEQAVAPTTQGGYGLAESEALAYSRYQALMNSNNHNGVSHNDFLSNSRAAMTAAGSALGFSMPSMSDYRQNANLEKPNAEGTRETVEGKAVQAVANAELAEGITYNGSNDAALYPGRDPRTTTSPDAQLLTEHGGNVGEVQGSASANQRAMATNEEEARMSALDPRWKENPYSGATAREFNGMVENGMAWAGRRMEQMSGALSAGANASAEEFEGKLRYYNENPEEARKLVDEARGKGTFSSLAQTTAGIAALGVEAARGGLGREQLDGMSIAELGAVYTAATASAYEAGSSASSDEWNRQQEIFRDQFRHTAKEGGMTNEQAEIFAHSLDNDLGNMNVLDLNGVGTHASDGLANALRAHRERYAITYTDDDGNSRILRDDNGVAILSEKDERFVEEFQAQIVHKARLGDVAQAGMTNIARYNHQTLDGTRNIVSGNEMRTHHGTMHIVQNDKGAMDRDRLEGIKADATNGINTSAEFTGNKTSTLPRRS